MPTRRLWTMLIVSALVLVVGRIVLLGPERCPPPSAAEARAAAAAAAGWLADNQRPDGTYTYAVDRAGRDLGDYNIVRHAGVTLSLYQAARAAADDDLLAAGDRGLAWMVDRLAERDDWVALAQGSDAPLGGSALLLAALAERREMTGDTIYDDTMRGLGRFLASLQKENGDFYTRTNVRTGEPDRVGISPYFAGEALWAIARLQNALPDRLFRTTAEQAARFISTERNDLDFVPVAPLNDHWGSYGFAEMADWPLGDAEADYARSVYGRFQLLIRWEATKDAGAPYSWTHGPERRAAALGTWVEGQGALARLARVDDRLDDLAGLTLDSTRCGAGVLVERQRDSDDVATDGAWFTDDETRMDDQQHAISGLLALAYLLEET
ncbi:MAG: hypothetical protein ABWZ15_15340 [Acidimicrobiia bacterium]